MVHTEMHWGLLIAVLAVLVARAAWVVLGPEGGETEEKGSGRRASWWSRRHPLLLAAGLAAAALAVGPHLAHAATLGNPIDDLNNAGTQAKASIIHTIDIYGTLGLGIAALVWLAGVKGGRALMFTVAGAWIGFNFFMVLIPWINGFFPAA